MEVLQAKEGNKFIRADRSAVYDTIMYLSSIDSKDNYVEVPAAEAEQLKAELFDTASNKESIA